MSIMTTSLKEVSTEELKQTPIAFSDAQTFMQTTCSSDQPQPDAESWEGGEKDFRNIRMLVNEKACAVPLFPPAK
jgi:hypothetical protein